MTRSLLVFAAFFSLASGCERQESTQNVPPVLQGEVIATGDYLDHPGQMVVSDDRLVVLDRSAPMVHVFSLPAGTHLGSFGQNGEGPGEYRSAWHVEGDAKNPRAVWIYDISLLRMTRLEFSQAPLPEVREVVNLNAGSGVFLHPVWLSDTTLVVSGITPTHADGRLLLTDRAGGVIRMLGKPPQHPGSAAIPTTVLQHAYEGPLAVRPDRARFALATRQADRLEIYRSDGNQLAEVVGTTGFLPEFEVKARAGGVSMATGDNLRVGYVDLAATRNHIYALFSGVLRRDAGSSTFFGREVHVFDWSGAKVARLQLDEPAFTIAVTPDGTRMYAVRHEPAPAIVRYSLPRPPPGG
jgi:hypothetical protein